MRLLALVSVLACATAAHAGRATLETEFGGGPGRVFRGQIEQRDSSALRREQPGSRPADAALGSGPRDDRDLVLQQHGRALPKR